FLGPQVSPIPIPFLTLPSPPVLPPTPPIDQDLEPGTVTTITPGGYRRIRVARQVTLTMLAGTYDVDEFRINGDSTAIRRDPNPPTPPACAIRVRTKLVLAATTLGDTPSLPFTFAYAGSKGVTVARPGGHVAATVNAPLARVTLKSGAKLPSTFVG